MLERDIVLTGLDAEGKDTVDLPVTRLGLIEDSARVKDEPEAGDYLALMDSGDGGEMKKALVSALARNLKLTGGQTFEDAIDELLKGLGAAQHALDGAAYHRVFEAEEWTGTVLRTPKAAHGMVPWEAAWQAPCVYALRARQGRTAREYDAGTAAAGAQSVIGAVEAALAANTAAAGTYPTAEDGHVLLTWEQVQYFLLEEVLVPAEEAAAKAAELGFGWKGRDDTGTEESVSLDGLLSAAYPPALGGSDAAFLALCTAQVLQGLRLRRAVPGQGHAAKYDLDGYLSPSWGTVGARLHWDPDGGDLVLGCAAPFAGDLLVMGRADAAPGGDG